MVDRLKQSLVADGLTIDEHNIIYCDDDAGEWVQEPTNVAIFTTIVNIGTADNAGPKGEVRFLAANDGDDSSADIGAQYQVTIRPDGSINVLSTYASSGAGAIVKSPASRKRKGR